MSSPGASVFARAIPVIASDTAGLRQVVEEGTGVLVPAGETTALADAMASVAADREGLSTMGLAALGVACGRTRTAMHHERAEAPVAMLDRT